ACDVYVSIADEAFCCQRSGELDQCLRNWSKKGRDLNLMLAYSSIKALRTPSRCALVSSFTRTSPIRSGVMRCKSRRRRAAVSDKGRVCGSRWRQSEHKKPPCRTDRKSTRLNSSHVKISYAVFCLKKKKKKNQEQ